MNPIHNLKLVLQNNGRGTYPTAARATGSQISAQIASSTTHRADRNHCGLPRIRRIMNPIIGITSRQPIIKTSGGDLEAHVVNKVYTDAVIRSGGTPITLPPVAPGEAPHIIDRIDGLVLSGGGDIDPSFYDGAVNDEMYAIDPRRDQFEFALVREAQLRRLPLLAICRGLQVLNVALGGSLIEDIPSEIGSTDHAIRGPEVVDCHQTVAIEPASLVAEAIGSTEACVNSIHHQAVRHVAPGFRAAGWTADGVVEVLDPDDHTWPVLAVQWHPEYLAVNDDEASIALFTGLVEAARHKAEIS